MLGQASCYDCAAGYYSTSGVSVVACIQCPKGWYQDLTGKICTYWYELTSSNLRCVTQASTSLCRLRSGIKCFYTDRVVVMYFAHASFCSKMYLSLDQISS